MVQCPDVIPCFAVAFILQQHPVQLLLVIPLDELPEFAAHKQQLFAGVRHHIAHKGAQPRKLLLVAAVHLVQHGVLAVYHLVV